MAKKRKTTKRQTRIKKAMKHKDVPGAGAKKRKKLKPSERGNAVMKEFARGTLRSSGKVVKSRKQAMAIAASESGKNKKRKKK